MSAAHRGWARFRRSPTAVAGVVVLALLGLASLLAPWLAPYDPAATDPRNMLRPPDREHWLGTDDIGRDVLSRLLYAGRVSQGMGIAVAVLSVSLGAVLGGLAGYFRGPVDAMISALIDVLLSVPMLALAMVVGAFVDLSPARLALLLAALAWPTPARIVRSQVLSLTEWTFVEAARAVGAGHRRVLFRHVLPNTWAPLSVAATLMVAQVILVESALSFLGFGVAPPTASWGNMLQGAQLYFRQAPWLAVFPGIAVSLTVAAVNFVGDGLREALQPRGK